MDRYRTTFATWNKVADQYADAFMDLDIYDDTYNKFIEILPSPTSTILEVGCGPGNVTRNILSKKTSLDWLGIDIAPSMIERAKEFNPKANFLIMDGRAIHTLNSSFDGIICGFFLPYISTKEVDRFIMDCHKLHSSKGILYLSFVNGDPDNSRFINNIQGDQMYFYYHRKGIIVSQLIQQGFQLLHNIPISYQKKEGSTEIHTILIAQK